MKRLSILVLAPMHNESTNMKNALESRTLKHSYKVVQCGVGKVNAAATIATEVNDYHKNYDLVVLVGYAAGSSMFSQGDIIVPDKTRYHDTNCSADIVEELAKIYPLEGNDEVTVLTGDSFVDMTKALELTDKFGKNVIFDMETCAVAQVLEEYNIPLLVMKMISDVPSEDSDNLVSFSDFCETHTDFKWFVDYLELL